MTNFIAETTDLLARTPAVLRALLIGLPDDWTDAPDVAEGWRPRDVVGHLITAEETDWMPRTRRILEQGTSVSFDRFDRFAMLERDAGVSLDQLVEQFATLRAGNLQVLRAWQLTEAQLDLPGAHPSLGRVTLRQLLAAWVVHDLGHIAQVARVMAKQYRNEIGPWAPYLPIVTDRPIPVS